jgi:transcriptional regulator with XRE-family HTH domain
VQPKISRLETGKQTPSEDDIGKWAGAVGASPDAIEELLAHARIVQAEYATWRRQFRLGAAPKQEEILELEARATTISEFQPVVIPGLLQTADYARQMLSLASGPARFGARDVDRMVATRLRRQQVIYEPGKRIRFVVTEATLRYRVCSREAQIGQLDRLLVVSGLPSIELGIVPFEVELPLIPLNAFIVYDRDLVAVETLGAELMLRDQEEIDLYLQFFEDMAATARSGEAARSILLAVLSELQQKPT